MPRAALGEGASVRVRRGRARQARPAPAAAGPGRASGRAAGSSGHGGQRGPGGECRAPLPEGERNWGWEGGIAPCGRGGGRQWRGREGGGGPWSGRGAEEGAGRWRRGVGRSCLGCEEVVPGVRSVTPALALAADGAGSAALHLRGRRVLQGAQPRVFPVQGKAKVHPEVTLLPCRCHTRGF